MGLPTTALLPAASCTGYEICCELPYGVKTILSIIPCCGTFGAGALGSSREDAPTCFTSTHSHLPECPGWWCLASHDGHLSTASSLNSHA